MLDDDGYASVRNPYDYDDNEWFGDGWGWTVLTIIVSVFILIAMWIVAWTLDAREWLRGVKW